MRRSPPLLLLLAAGCLPSPALHPRGAAALRAGYAHLAAGDAERAEVAFEHALEYAPDLPEGWNGLGVVARSRGDAAAALARFDRAIRLRPGFAEGHANRGEALLALGRRAEALEALRAALRVDPALGPARRTLALALLHDGLGAPARRARRWAEARRQYLHLLEASPDDAAALQHLAFMDYLSGRLQRAAAGYRRAVALAPGPEALHGLCAAAALLGRCGEARRACQRCLELAPSAEACRVSLRGAAACQEVAPAPPAGDRRAPP
jgi:tetratricopeptide (TPR) repeat protein